MGRAGQSIGSRCGAVLTLALLLLGCAHTPISTHTVQLHLDGTDRTVSTSASTVRALLNELEVELGPLDEVEPPLWTPLEDDLAIRVIRGYEEASYETLPHEERTIRDEFLDPDETQVIREGVDGQAELRYLAFWDGAELLERQLVSREVVSEPVTAVYLEGSRGLLPNVAIEGTLAYLVNGEPWIIQQDTDSKRPLARGVQADGRVFSLSPDGRYLLYTALADSAETLNALYLIRTDVLNSHPEPLGIDNVLWGAWSPQGNAFAYASLEPTEGVPGWRAVNDLHVVAYPDGDELAAVAIDTAFAYAWYGERWLWLPDGSGLVYARPDGVGLVALDTLRRQEIVSFAPGPAGELEVWLPDLAVTPDGATLLWTQYDGEIAEGVLYGYDLASGETDRLAEGVSAPTLTPAGQSVVLAIHDEEEAAHLAMLNLNAPTLTTLRRDAQVSWPAQMAWGPKRNRLVYVYAGDLYLYDLQSSRLDPLTATGLADHPVWR